VDQKTKSNWNYGLPIITGAYQGVKLVGSKIYHNYYDTAKQEEVDPFGTLK